MFVLLVFIPPKNSNPSAKSVSKSMYFRSITCTNYIQQLSDTKWPIAFHRALGSTGLFGIFSFSSYGQNATRGGLLIRLL